MKKIFVIVAAAVLSVAFAEEEYISPVTGKPVPKDGKYTLEQYKARDQRVLKKTGGFLQQKAEGPLTLLVDGRAKPTLTVNEVARLYKLGTHLDVNFDKKARGKECPLDFARKLMEDRKPLMVVVVVDNEAKLPALSVFPEERIGIVNADRLKGGSDPSAPEMRVSKEMWRAMGFIGGVGFSAQENDMMQPYYTLAEIDANMHPYIQPMNMAKMQKMWKRFGVKKERRIPYIVACQEGWAPAPTNEYQKAIWERVTADKERGPTNPLKIPPPKRK